VYGGLIEPFLGFHEALLDSESEGMTATAEHFGSPVTAFYE